MARTPDRTADTLAPIDIVVVGFPDGAPHPQGFTRLLKLADQGTIRVLDLEFVVRDADGARIVAAQDLPATDGFDAELWAGAGSGLLDREDLAVIAAELSEGELAAAILIEQQWVLDLVGTWEQTGARLIADGGVPVEDLLAALDSAEQN